MLRGQQQERDSHIGARGHDGMPATGHVIATGQHRRVILLARLDDVLHHDIVMRSGHAVRQAFARQNNRSHQPRKKQDETCPHANSIH
ncbi:hypothetical protein [Maliponia aquimaris]|uniref:hypothetical protein n=1 Tax=Maliponia aquimaris TaxID=1673631 RepID=UPI000B8AC340|nr:hypothetical protein [Maliponia aquimaris]